MDKQPIGRMIIAIITAVAAIAAFVLPEVLRVQMVASMGVLSANSITWFVNGIGVICGIITVGILVILARQAIAQQRAGALATLEAKQWENLPSKDESSLDVLEPALRRVGNRYADVKPLIDITLEQVTSIRQSLAKIGDIFRANAGLVSKDQDRFASVEYLIEKVLEEMCPGLVRIIYQAHEHDGANTFVPDLIDVIETVNAANDMHVNATRELANSVVAASTRGDSDSVVEQVNTAIQKLNSPDKEGWLSK